MTLNVKTNLVLLGLYRGIIPTSQRAICIAAVELPVYDFSKNYFLPLVGDQPVNHFISSFFASLLAAIASTPIDVIRTRLMNQKRVIKEASIHPVLSSPVYFNSSFECLKSILKYEGILALWKGNTGFKTMAMNNTDILYLLQDLFLAG